MSLRPQESKEASLQPERTMSRSYFPTGIGYLAAYVVLDRISYVHPFAEYGITPWNPQAGLSFVLILLRGPKYLPWLFFAPLLADFAVRDFPLPLLPSLTFAAITAVIYGAAALFLMSLHLQFDPALRTKHDLILLISVAAISAAVVAFGHGGALVMAGFAVPNEFVQVVVRAFIGDLIGIMIFATFLLMLFTRQALPALSGEAAAVALLLLTSLWLVFGFSQAFQFQLFYLFFLPIVWIAMRSGLEGAAWGLVLMQGGLIVAIELSGQSGGHVLAYQALMVVLALTGLSVGMLIDEQRRTQQQLRLHQEAIHRAARVGAVGEFAATVAHEINQPLTAIANYLQIAKRAAEENPPNGRFAVQATIEAIAQVERAGAVIHRLREFIRGGHVETTHIRVDTLVNQALMASRPELERHGIVCEVRFEKDIPAVHADALQIQQVILNLVRNAMEALADAGRRDGRITIHAAREGPSSVSIRIQDNGPGLESGLIGQPISSFTTTKPGGLGLGLSISRSIVEAHGGVLRIENMPSGASAAFSLPTVKAPGVSQ